MKSKILIVLTVLALLYIAGSIAVGGDEDGPVLVCPTSAVSQADCRLCGDSGAAKNGGMGLLCLNTWAYEELRLWGTDTHDHFTLSSNMDPDACAWNIMTNPARHTADVTITYGKSPEVSFDRLAEQLCQDCLDQVFRTATEWLGKEERPRCALLMDADSGTLYPVSAGLTGYYINDFWVHIDPGEAENRTRVYLIYNPPA